MKKLGVALALYLALASATLAQVVTTAPFPSGAQPINKTISSTFTTSGGSATLTAVAGKWTYICGFTVTSGATSAAAIVNMTVTGTVGGTMNFAYVYVSTGQGVFGIAFPGCISSSAVNTPIVITIPASGGTGTTGAVTAWGYTN